MASNGLPSLSEIRDWDIDHLTQAADDWVAEAQRWETAFDNGYRQLAATDWKGQARDAAVERAGHDLVKVRGLASQLQEAATVARYGAEQQYGAKQETLNAVADAEQAGFRVGEALSVTDRQAGGAPVVQAARRAQAQGHAAYLRHRAAQLVASNQQLAAQITAATAGLGNVTFEEAPTQFPARPHPNGGIQAVDHHTFKQAPNPAPDPPPGGWSEDPLMRAAQKIAYGHASGPDGHMGDFPGMTKEQLADVIHRMMQDSVNNPSGLILGNSRTDGAPVIYDPKNNIAVIRDPTGAARGSDAGTVFKPQDGSEYILGNREAGKLPKITERIEGFPPDRLGDFPPPGGPPAGEPGAVKVPDGAPAPVEASPPGRTSPAIGEGDGAMPRLPNGIGVPADSPATGPHPVYPPHGHHRAPLLGELPDEMEDP